MKKNLKLSNYMVVLETWKNYHLLVRGGEKAKLLVMNSLKEKR